jgi:hypothetical protein
MKHAQWEYAYVTWTDTLRKITKSSPEYDLLSDKVKKEWQVKEWTSYPWREQKFYMRFPGTEETIERLSWQTGESEYRLRKDELLNELGADGWEMVSNVVMDHAMGPGYGRNTTSFPVRTTTWLRRPVVSD